MKANKQREAREIQWPDDDNDGDDEEDTRKIKKNKNKIIEKSF